MSSEITATPEMLRVITRLGKVVDHLPAVFPTPGSPTIKPLALGTSRQVHTRVKPPEGMSEAKAHAIVADSLRFYVQSPRYRAALAATGAWRHDLDGNPVEPVSQDHAAFARHEPTEPQKEIINVLVPAIKVTLPLRPEQLQPLAETVKSIDLTLDLGDGNVFVAPFAGKTYRRALRQVDDLRATGAEVIVIMQGRLVAGHRIEGAGLAVQAKVPKAEA